MRVNHPGLAGGIDVECAVERHEIGRGHRAVFLDEREGALRGIAHGDHRAAHQIGPGRHQGRQRLLRVMQRGEQVVFPLVGMDLRRPRGHLRDGPTVVRAHEHEERSLPGGEVLALVGKRARPVLARLRGWGRGIKVIGLRGWLGENPRIVDKKFREPQSGARRQRLGDGVLGADGLRRLGCDGSEHTGGDGARERDEQQQFGCGEF